MLIEKMRYTEELGGYLEKIVKEINNKKDIYTKEQKELLGIVIKLVLNKKLDKKEIEELINELKEEEKDMLAVLEMIEEENKRLLRQGRKEGRELGEKRGRKIGIIEGANQRSIEIAKNMLREKSDIEFISKITGLKKEEIEKIKKQCG